MDIEVGFDIDNENGQSGHDRERGEKERRVIRREDIQHAVHRDALPRSLGKAAIDDDAGIRTGTAILFIQLAEKFNARRVVVSGWRVGTGLWRAGAAQGNGFGGALCRQCSKGASQKRKSERDLDLH